jgi:MoaA/NifB/PqqE/SkfB family radical SAM enzyme
MATPGEAVAREHRRRLLYQLPYFVRFALQLLVGRPLPVIAGMAITDMCNLDCLHCWRKNQGRGHAPYTKVDMALHRLYALGARYLYLQGGEPCTWRDGNYTLRDVVHKAKEIGFFHVAICTNGTFPLDAAPDSYSISVEGSAIAHDTIRSGSYAKVTANIEASSHPYIFVNATFNKKNCGELETIAQWVAASPRIRGVLVNFHIPYPGVEHLSLAHDERERIAQQAMQLKRSGYPILNTCGGLRAMARNDWKRPLDLSVVTDCDAYYSCCRARGQEQVCRECGYAGWVELSLVLDWNWRSVWETVKKFGRH